MLHAAVISPAHSNVRVVRVCSSDGKGGAGQARGGDDATNLIRTDYGLRTTDYGRMYICTYVP